MAKEEEKTQEELEREEKETREKKEKEAQDVVTLPRADYNLLLEELTDLQKKKEVVDLDALVQKGKERKGEEREPQERKAAPRTGYPTAEELDQMSTSQVLPIALQFIKEEYIDPLVHEQHVDRLARQIEKVADEFEDFWEIEEDVTNLLVATPGLSPRKAYILAKHERGEEVKPTGKKKGKEGGEDTQEVVLNVKGKKVTLPPRRVTETPQRGQTIVPNSVKNAPETVREAANRAWEELKIQE